MLKLLENPMTRFSSDQLAKQYLQDFLEPLGLVQRNFEVPGEAKYVDVWFDPTPNAEIGAEDLGLLGQIAKTPCLLEPFRNAPSIQEVKTCVLKLLWIQEDQYRRADRDKHQLLNHDLAHLWVLATRIDQPTIYKLGGHQHPDWPTGVFFLAESWDTILVAINKLPITPETLWLRLLGKGKTLEQAITEVLALSSDGNRRSQVLQLLTNWRVSLQLQDPLETEEQELMATLSQAYLDWERQTEQRGSLQEARSLVLRQLVNQVGELPSSLQAQLEALPLTQLEDLGLALLNFQNLTDLENWLAQG
jgi:Domain of unknown function (DUF4351)